MATVGLWGPGGHWGLCGRKGEAQPLGSEEWRWGVRGGSLLPDPCPALLGSRESPSPSSHHLINPFSFPICSVLWGLSLPPALPLSVPILVLWCGFFFCHTLHAVVPHPLLWKPKVLTTGPSGNSPLFLFFTLNYLFHLCFSHLKNCYDLLGPFSITRPSHSSKNITSADTQVMGIFMVPFFRRLIKVITGPADAVLQSMLLSAMVTPLSLCPVFVSSGPCLPPSLLSGSPLSFFLSLFVSFPL